MVSIFNFNQLTQSLTAFFVKKNIVQNLSYTLSQTDKFNSFDPPALTENQQALIAEKMNTPIFVKDKKDKFFFKVSINQILAQTQKILLKFPQIKIKDIQLVGSSVPILIESDASYCEQVVVSLTEDHSIKIQLPVQHSNHNDIDIRIWLEGGNAHSRELIAQHLIVYFTACAKEQNAKLLAQKVSRIYSKHPIGLKNSFQVIRSYSKQILRGMIRKPVNLFKKEKDKIRKIAKSQMIVFEFCPQNKMTWSQLKRLRSLARFIATHYIKALNHSINDKIFYHYFKGANILTTLNSEIESVAELVIKEEVFKDFLNIKKGRNQFQLLSVGDNDFLYIHDLDRKNLLSPDAVPLSLSATQEGNHVVWRGRFKTFTRHILQGFLDRHFFNLVRVDQPSKVSEFDFFKFIGYLSKNFDVPVPSDETLLLNTFIKVMHEQPDLTFLTTYILKHQSHHPLETLAFLFNISFYLHQTGFIEEKNQVLKTIDLKQLDDNQHPFAKTIYEILYCPTYSFDHFQLFMQTFALLNLHTKKECKKGLAFISRTDLSEPHLKVCLTDLSLRKTYSFHLPSCLVALKSCANLLNVSNEARLLFHQLYLEIFGKEDEAMQLLFLATQLAPIIPTRFEGKKLWLYLLALPCPITQQQEIFKQAEALGVWTHLESDDQLWELAPLSIKQSQIENYFKTKRYGQGWKYFDRLALEHVPESLLTCMSHHLSQLEHQCYDSFTKLKEFSSRIRQLPDGPLRNQLINNLINQSLKYLETTKITESLLEIHEWWFVLLDSSYLSVLQIETNFRQCIDLLNALPKNYTINCDSVPFKTLINKILAHYRKSSLKLDHLVLELIGNCFTRSIDIRYQFNDLVSLLCIYQEKLTLEGLDKNGIQLVTAICKKFTDNFVKLPLDKQSLLLKTFQAIFPDLLKWDHMDAALILFDLLSSQKEGNYHENANIALKIHIQSLIKNEQWVKCQQLIDHPSQSRLFKDCQEYRQLLVEQLFKQAITTEKYEIALNLLAQGYLLPLSDWTACWNTIEKTDNQKLITKTWQLWLPLGKEAPANQDTLIWKNVWFAAIKTLRKGSSDLILESLTCFDLLKCHFILDKKKEEKDLNSEFLRIWFRNLLKLNAFQLQQEEIVRKLAQLREGIENNKGLNEDSDGIETDLKWIQVCLKHLSVLQLEAFDRLEQLVSKPASLSQREVMAVVISELLLDTIKLEQKDKLLLDRLNKLIESSKKSTDLKLNWNPFLNQLASCRQENLLLLGLNLIKGLQDRNLIIDTSLLKKYLLNLLTRNSLLIPSNLEIIYQVMTHKSVVNIEELKPCVLKWATNHYRHLITDCQSTEWVKGVKSFLDLIPKKDVFILNEEIQGIVINLFRELIRAKELILFNQLTLEYEKYIIQGLNSNHVFELIKAVPEYQKIIKTEIYSQFECLYPQTYLSKQLVAKDERCGKELLKFQVSLLHTVLEQLEVDPDKLNLKEKAFYLDFIYIKLATILEIYSSYIFNIEYLNIIEKTLFICPTLAALFDFHRHYHLPKLVSKALHKNLEVSQQEELKSSISSKSTKKNSSIQIEKQAASKLFELFLLMCCDESIDELFGKDYYFLHSEKAEILKQLLHKLLNKKDKFQELLAIHVFQDSIKKHLILDIKAFADCLDIIYNTIIDKAEKVKDPAFLKIFVGIRDALFIGLKLENKKTRIITTNLVEINSMKKICEKLFEAFFYIHQNKLEKEVFSENVTMLMVDWMYVMHNAFRCYSDSYMNWLKKMIPIIVNTFVSEDRNQSLIDNLKEKIYVIFKAENFFNEKMSSTHTLKNRQRVFEEFFKTLLSIEKVSTVLIAREVIKMATREKVYDGPDLVTIYKKIPKKMNVAENEHFLELINLGPEMEISTYKNFKIAHLPEMDEEMVEMVKEYLTKESLGGEMEEKDDKGLVVLSL